MPGKGVVGDRPITLIGQDVLGFGEMTRHLAAALVDRANRDGIVIGLEGAWGSGKSSMLGITVAELRAMTGAGRPVVVPFQPWLIGNRDALLTTLFDELGRAVDAMELEAGDATRSTIATARKAGDRLRGYGRRLGALAPAAALAGLAGVPFAGVAEKALKAVGEASKAEAAAPPLASVKAELDATLAELPGRIVVTIDDVDRLEPAEIGEILRLVRSVADFRNVVYVLCYDPAIVAEAVTTAMGIGDGAPFLEKIVQVAVTVPAPEPLALRQMFESGLREFALPTSEEEASRLGSVIDREGGRRLRTPRSVVRALDAMRLAWPGLRGRVDLADLTWITLVKLGNPALHRWVETYISAVAALSGGGLSVDDAARKRAFAELERALAIDGDEFDTARYRLAEVLPGIATGSLKGAGDRKPIYDIQGLDQSGAIAERRLASSDHHRLYFAFSTPAGVPVEGDYAALWAAADGGRAAVADLLGGWLDTPAFGGATKAALMLDRVEAVPMDRVTPARALALILGLADVLDHPAAAGHEYEFGGSPTWRRAERLLPHLRGVAGPEMGQAALIEAFRTGAALSWLSRLLRNELFAHGLFGDQEKTQEQWLLDEAAFGDAVTAMHGRYAALGIRGLLALRRPTTALFAWFQSGGEEDVRSRLADFTASDEGLVDALSALATGVRTGNRGTELILGRETLAKFTDYDEALARTVRLAEGDGPLAERARVLRSRFERAADF